MDTLQFRSSPAYGPSLLLHGGVIVAIFLIGLFFSRSAPPAPQIFQMVAGQGDNYQATEATALGAPNGLKFDLPQTAPTPPAPAEPTPPAAAAETVPLEAVTPPVAPPKKTVHKPAQHAPAATTAANGTPVPNFAKEMRWQQIKAESAAKMKKLREQRLARLKAIQEAREEARRQGETWEQFQREQHVAGGKGLATGVVHGMSMEKGAGGHALTAQQQDAMAAWVGMLRERWEENFVPPPDFNDSMTAHVKWYVSADGSISNVRITRSSGSAAFEQAVIEALQRVHVPPPPVHKGDEYDTEFSLKNDAG